MIDTDQSIMAPGHRVRLNNGALMPILGMGTWGLQGERCRRAVMDALDIGYRLIDTASMYGNEEEVGQAVRDSRLDRSEIFITTKVASTDQGYEGTLTACQNSLERLGMDSVDLYLVHWPVAGKSLDTWRAMEKLLSKGMCRAIGVSNYTIPLLEEIQQNGAVVPAVNQVEVNPFVYDPDMVRYCEKNGIRMEGYSPLSRGSALQERAILEIASAYEMSPAQVLLRWAIQKGIVVIPKASTPEHLLENWSVFDFELYFGDMDKLDALSSEERPMDR